jgi:indolepyruvate ferredoxin oxidoreductase beta subunit
VLPFSREAFEATIEAGGRGAAASLKAFRAGYEATQRPESEGALGLSAAAPPRPKGLGTVHGPEREVRACAALIERISREFPEEARPMLLAGLEKVVDFQDADYGGEYLDRLKALQNRDQEYGGPDHAFRFTIEAAKYVANAMAYDDVIRVADLKTRASRFRRIEKEMAAGPDQILRLTEFMHPRVEEVCGTRGEQRPPRPH